MISLRKQVTANPLAIIRPQPQRPRWRRMTYSPPSEYKPINLDLYDDTPERSNTLRRVLGFLLALIPVVILAYLLVQFGLPLLLDQSAGLTANPTATATLPPEGTPPATPLIVLGGTFTADPCRDHV